jgi:hypothetical protein
MMDDGQFAGKEDPVQGLKDQYWSWWMSSFALTAL